MKNHLGLYPSPFFHKQLGCYRRQTTSPLSGMRSVKQLTRHLLAFATTLSCLLATPLKAIADTTLISWENRPMYASSIVNLKVIIPEKLVMTTSPVFQRTAWETGWSGLASTQGHTHLESAVSQPSDKEASLSVLNEIRFFHNLPSTEWVTTSYQQANSDKLIYIVVHP